MTRLPYYDEPVEIVHLAPAAPTVIWGVLMVAALAGAGVTVWRGGAAAGDERLIATAPQEAALKRDVAKLATERDELAGRVALLERSLGELKLASRSQSAPETTGSITRSLVTTTIEPKPGAFGLSLGPDASLDAVKRRWGALSARYSSMLGKLNPRAQRSGDAPGMFDLVAGPFPSRAEADRACAALAEQGLACDTTSYGGEPIGRP